MKTISIKQPWASLVVEDIKDIENRTWSTKVRGRVLVHASATPVKGLPSEIVNNLQYANIFNSQKLHALNGLNGAIIGSVEIVDCVINHPSIWAEKSGPKSIDYLKQTYNWVLAKPIVFDKPITGVKGKLNFWEFELPEQYINEIERKLNS